ncbi:VOC family protein [Blastococcus sp. URHD0036]|uniref:VOC family protein n=1 Tax=Blastococcus sp. URHD0036 TaxID=1380356 RepID=UPI00049799CF|nr:VOC family protein [Blastococcus sp. URHD0036]
MLKVHVDDIDEAGDFYGTVFGATLAMDLGEGHRVMTMPGGPGFILIQDRADERNDWNAQFLIQVSDLERTEALALENGAEHQQAFEGSPGGEQAFSVDLLDPWGNQIEILQRG